MSRARIVDEAPRLLRDRRATDAARITASTILAQRDDPDAILAAHGPGRPGQLRGIPVVGGCRGTQPGTDPLLHALGDCPCDACAPRRKLVA